MHASTTRSLSALLLILLSTFTTLSAAWPWPEPNLNPILAARQDSGSSSAQQSASASSSASRQASSSASASASGSASASDSASGTITQGPSKTGSSPSSGSSDSGRTSYDERLPAGGVSMITPAPLSGAQYYKIGYPVTFAWNYTSLSSTPSAIDVVASCAQNQQTYPIAINQTVQPTGNVTWDTGPLATAATPLVMASYTLLIYDSEAGPSARPSAGYLGLANSVQFAMYSTKAATALPSYVCATCNGASGLSASELQVMKFAVGMSAITVLSFTWFVRGLGILA